MNYHLAQRSLHLAIIFRDSARWHAQHGATAKTMVNSARAMEALAARQTARDVSPFSFEPLEAA